MFVLVSAVVAIGDQLLARSASPGARLVRADRLSRSGAHGRAVKLFASAARAGVSAAQYQLGRAYLYGRGLPACLPAALYWLQKAGTAGETEAQALLAQLAALGIKGGSTSLFAATRASGEPEYREIHRWAVPAAAAGSADAQALLAFVLEQGPEELRDPGRAECLYNAAAKAGCPQGELAWAITLLRQAESRGQQDTLQEVRALLRSAAAAKLPMAHHLLALLAEGDARCDRAEVIGAFRIAAEMGYAPSQLRLGIALIDGDGVPRDTFEGETWLRRAALAGEGAAAAFLGDFYAREGDLPPNFAEAAIWYRQAAEGGNAAAARAMGRLLLEGPARDVAEAVVWLRTAISHGDWAARVDLAGLARERLVSEDDQQETFAWFARVAQSGDAAALFNLGLCYAEGIGTARDDREAFVCFQRASTSIAAAGYWCGRMHAEGRGVPADHEAARNWYLSAAAAGCADAQAAAGEMLANGRGGERDLDRARALFSQAAAAGHGGAIYALQVLAAAGRPRMEQSDRPALAYTD